jgi:hypothetical protein
MDGLNLEGADGKSLAVRIFKRIPAVIGCLLFLCSMFFPFYRFMFATMIGQSFSVYYWSYKSAASTIGLRHPFGIPQSISESWFCDYWFGDTFMKGFGLSWVLVFMFAAQISILGAGIISIFNPKRILALVPTVMCPIVLTLMIYTNIRLYNLNLVIDLYQPGYWLTYPSTALFIVNFLIKEKTN